MHDRKSPALLRQLLRYEPETGRLFWLLRDVSFFPGGSVPAEWSCRAWNARYADQEAFTAVNGRGYRHGTIFDRHMRAHQVAWAMMTGHWPLHEIDHENGDKTDNRWVNLRDGSNGENGRNMPMPRRNTSGRIGVYYRKDDEVWFASIAVNGRRKHLGTFNSFSDACAARARAEVAYGYHPNHGRKTLGRPSDVGT